MIINLYRTTPSKSLVRLYGLNLLINMSVLEYLHEEYMSNINELGLLIESTIEYDDEALSSGKILVNLSTNKLNLENLLKLTVKMKFLNKNLINYFDFLFKGVELKTIINLFTSKSNQSSRSEEILLRYLTFYCNLADIIINEITQGEDTNNNNSWLNDPTPQRQGALYFEFFDHVWN